VLIPFGISSYHMPEETELQQTAGQLVVTLAVASTTCLDFDMRNLHFPGEIMCQSHPILMISL